MGNPLLYTSLVDYLYQRIGLLNQGLRPASDPLAVTYTNNLYTILYIYYIDNA